MLVQKLFNFKLAELELFDYVDCPLCVMVVAIIQMETEIVFALVVIFRENM